jgi:hypothetical protein
MTALKKFHYKRWSAFKRLVAGLPGTSVTTYGYTNHNRVPRAQLANFLGQHILNLSETIFNSIRKELEAFSSEFRLADEKHYLIEFESHMAVVTITAPCIRRLIV